MKIGKCPDLIYVKIFYKLLLHIIKNIYILENPESTESKKLEEKIHLQSNP